MFNIILKKVFQKLKISNYLIGLLYPFASKIIHDREFDSICKELSLIHPDPNSSSIVNRVVSFKHNYDVTIIVPAFNAEKFLARCLNSILFQKTDFSYRVIVVDDGSKDSTKQIAASFCNKFPHIFSLISQSNKGHSGARNSAINKVQSEFIMFVDSDDILTETAVQSLVYSARINELDIVEGGYVILKRGSSHTVRYLNEEIPVTNTGFPWGKLFRSTLFENIQFPVDYWFEDTIIIFLVCFLASSIKSINDIVYVYTADNSASISHNFCGNCKSLDTLYITRSCLLDQHRLNIFVDNSFSLNLFLRQVVFNYRRLDFFPSNVKKTIFLFTVHLLKSNFSTENCDPQYKILYDALINFDFGLYSLFCSFSNCI